MERFRPLEQCREDPIVVPWNVWLKDRQRPDETTASRLVFHWLERAKRIRLCCIKPAHLDMTLKENDVSGELAGKLLDVFHVLLKDPEMKGKMTQISLQEARKELRISVSMFMDAVLALEEKQVLELHNTIYCDLTERRSGETMYAVQEGTNRYFGLHIFFDVLRGVLKDCEMERVYEVDAGQRERYAQLMEEACFYEAQELVLEKREKNGKKKDDVYMPWKNAIANLQEYAVIRYETFKKDIARLGVRRMFLILAHTPGVTFKDDRDIQRYRVVTDEWRDFLPSLEEDCLKWLRCICEKDRYTPFNWSSLARKAGLLDKGYGRFCTVLTILRRLGYITHSPLLPYGIEVLSTEKTAEALDDGVDPSSPLYALRMEFNEQEQIKKARLSCMNIFSLIKSKDDRNTFIRQYFQCTGMKTYLKLLADYTSKTNLDQEAQEKVLKELNDEALEEAVGKLNEEQKEIYNHSVQEHINVLAGPGSGKTHVLTLRCARLIYAEKVDPRQVLVLAYNRAVVVELRNRLNDLFDSLGLSRFARRIPVYTFHGLAKHCLDSKLENIKPEEWDEKFKEFLKDNKSKFKAIFPQIRHVLVDEFQDITQNRLEYLEELHNIFPEAKFFTIGDINQSIYGFDRIPREEKNRLSPEKYARFLDPQHYYDRWNELLNPEQMTMFTNYRSYQKILDFSKRYLLSESEMPTSSDDLRPPEPKDPYVFEYEVTEEDFSNPNPPWLKEITDTIEWAKKENESGDKKSRRIRTTIAVFFRTNAEVFRAYSKLRDRLEENVRLRIQGQSVFELWRKREFHEFIYWLQKEYENEKFDLNENPSSDRKKYSTYGDIKELLLKKTKRKYKEWDTYYLDLLETLIHNYVDSYRTENEAPTFGQLIEYIKDIAGTDDWQAYKIYDYYQKDEEIPVSVVLTTMHKVKGLEFDAVITVPSMAELPLKRHTQSPELNKADTADLDEEKRLMFVACTRAKKRLCVFTGPREKAMMAGTAYSVSKDSSVFFYEKDPKLDKYNLGFNASYNNYSNYKTILNIRAQEPVRIRKDTSAYFNIVTENGTKLGQLLQNSNIAKAMKQKGISLLKGYFVSDVIAWTKEDVRRYDDAIKNVRAQEPVCIRKDTNDHFNIITENGTKLGQLSKKSNIAKAMQREGISVLEGFFVSDVVAWKYTESLESDKKNHTSYSKNWCDEAKKKGYVYVPIISGMGEPA